MQVHYAYVPARQVYDLTVMNLVITLVMYTLDTVGVENEDVIADPLRLEQILINIMRREVHAGRWADQPVDCTEGYGSGRLCRF